MSGYGSLPVWLDPTAWAGRTYSPPAAQDIGTIQAAIAAQLASYFSGAGLSIPVYVYPDFDLDTWWASNAIAFVLISYEDSKLGKPMATDAMVQERVLGFDLHVEARRTAWALNGTGSVYALIDAIEAALTGFRPTSCRNAYFVSERFRHKEPDEGQVWLYDMRLEVPTLKLKTEPSYALANLVKAQMYAAALAAAGQGLLSSSDAPLIGGNGAPVVDGNGVPIVVGPYQFASGTLTLPGTVPLVVGAIANAQGTRLYQRFVDWNCDGATGVVTALSTGAIGQNDQVQIAWASADTITVVSTGGTSPTFPTN